MIEINGVSFAYGRGQALRDVSMRMENGQVLGIVGPNGAGKSTLLRLCARILRPAAGDIRVDGRPCEQYRARPYARQLAFLPQLRPTPDVSVQALVRMGRFAHAGGHDQAVNRALQAVGLEPLAGRGVRALSGGQRQLAYLAMLLAQDSPNMLLDEPFAHLDIGAQLDAARIVRRMRDEGRCVVVVMHDLSLLHHVCDRVILLHQGQTAFDGTPEACLSSQALARAFGVRVIPGGAPGFERGGA